MTKRTHKFEVSPERADVGKVKALSEKNVLHSLIFELYNSGYRPAPISQELDINHYTIRGLLNKRNQIIKDEQEELFDGVSILTEALMSYVEILRHKGLQPSAKSSLQQLSSFLNGGFTNDQPIRETGEIAKELKFQSQDPLEIAVPSPVDTGLINEMEELITPEEKKPSGLELQLSSAVQTGELPATSKRGRKSNRQKDIEKVIKELVKATAADRGIVLGRGRPSPEVQEQLKAIELEIKTQFNVP